MNAQELTSLCTAIENSVNIVFITDIHGTIEYVNDTLEHITDYSKTDVLGQSIDMMMSPDVSREQIAAIWEKGFKGEVWRDVLKIVKKSGRNYWCDTTVVPVRNHAGKIVNFLILQEDVTGKMLAEERIGYISQYDEITGLLNRSSFITLLNRWLQRPGNAGLNSSIILIDVDQFKFVNDSYGHGVGDALLNSIAKLLQGLAGGAWEGLARENRKDPAFINAENPLMSRLAADEFAVFLPLLDEKQGLQVAEFFRSEIEKIYFPEATASITVSIGIASYPAHGRDAKDLLARVDAALYRAKELGRNRCHIYSPEDKEIENLHAKLIWKEHILKALKEDRFVPWFQPILNIRDKTITHYETLARMINEEGKIVSPGLFIGIAEIFGLINQIDMLMIEKTIKIQSRLSNQGRSFCFSINLSGKNLGNEELLSFILEKIYQEGISPRSIIFEVTETAAISDFNKALTFLTALKKIGCRVSLDDFGVGFTSFVYLREMQPDYIKIDGSFIRRLVESREDQFLVKAINDVSHSLNIKTIAEFVETEPILDLLTRYQVDYAQGYLIGRPASLI